MSILPYDKRNSYYPFSGLFTNQKDPRHLCSCPIPPYRIRNDGDRKRIQLLRLCHKLLHTKPLPHGYSYL